MKRIVAIQGGLGNQMFDYAFFLALKEKKKNVVLNDYLLRIENVHNGCELNPLFGIQIPRFWYNDVIIFLYKKLYYTSQRQSLYGKTAKYILSILRSLGIGLCIEPEHGIYDPLYLVNSYLLYWSTWHSEKYFSVMRPSILSAFKFQENLLNDKTKSLSNRIQKEESVSVHIRRGDYFMNSNASRTYGGICTTNYYNHALNIIMEKTKDTCLFVFSDDIPWAKDNIEHLNNATFIDWNKKEESWQDMYLMSLCKHNIIANSTFSWWAAWLNTNSEKIVICPDKIMNQTNPVDLMPESWVIIKG